MTEAAALDSPGPPTARPRRPWVRVAQVGLGLAVAIGMLVWGLPYFTHTSWSEIFGVLRTVPPWKGALFLGLTVAGLYSYTFVMNGAMPGLGQGRALILNTCSSSVSNMLPGGGAVGLAATFSIARSWGFSVANVTTMAVVTGVWNVLARAALPIIAIIGLSMTATDLTGPMRDAAVAAVVTALIVATIFVAAIATDTGARVVGAAVDRLLRLVLRRHRDGVERTLTELRARIAETVRHGWIALTVGMIGFFGFYYVLFTLCLQATGVEMGFGQLFAAFAIGRLLNAVGVTPGGIGVSETGAAAALVAWGANGASATAGVVIFSIFTHFMLIPLGAIGWIAWSMTPKASAKRLERVERYHST